MIKYIRTTDDGIKVYESLCYQITVSRLSESNKCIIYCYRHIAANPCLPDIKVYENGQIVIDGFNVLIRNPERLNVMREAIDTLQDFWPELSDFAYEHGSKAEPKVSLKETESFLELMKNHRRTFIKEEQEDNREFWFPEEN